MIISFRRSHLSIASFPSIKLPDFTLITGPNGAGKSHFLQALQNGSLHSDFAPNQSINNQTEIRLFDWSTLVPQDTGLFSSETLHNERMNLYQHVQNVLNDPAVMEPARQTLRQFNVDSKYVSNPALFAKLSDTEFAQLSIEKAKYSEFRSAIDKAFNFAEERCKQGLNPGQLQEIMSISNYTKRPIFCVSQSEMVSAVVPSWGTNNIFQQSFARLFVAYRNLYLANQLAELRNRKGDKNASYLSDEKFREVYGPAPWDFVNDSLKEAQLDFSIDRPDLDSYSQYQPKLTKNDSGISIPFSALSSGEKVLMSFAFCVYYASDRRQISIHPKILLFDEVDAPLHPSMSKNLISTVTRTLIANFGIKVIATTHSPSTVALAPDESLHLMKPGVPGLHKSSKSEALNILTVGVPTLAISFDGRRQVFVESKSDAILYDQVHKICKNLLNPEVSLEFIPTGLRSKDGNDTHTGCDIVKNLVNELSKSGNMSIFGLIDWDNKNDPTNRIAVLSHGRRNGLENLLLDPLLIASLICRDFYHQRHIIGIDKSVGWVQFCNYKEIQLQNIVDVVSNRILGGENSDKTISRFVGGLSLRIPKTYTTTDDHDLEAKIIAAFPFLQSITRSKPRPAGRLMQQIVQNVIADQPAFVPHDLVEVFQTLTSLPAHS